MGLPIIQSGAPEITQVVFRGQPTDAFPTSIHIAVLSLMNMLLATMQSLSDVFTRKVKQFESVVEMGRTHLQDAVPHTWGMKRPHGLRGKIEINKSVRELCLLYQVLTEEELQLILDPYEMTHP